MYFTPCFYPTTVLFLDDDPEFFGSISQNLCPLRAHHKDFICPSLFLEYVNNTHTNRFIREYVTFVCPEAYDHYRHDVNVVDLRNIATDPLRFDEVSVVVLDYNMPMINGLEVAGHIQNPHIKKILLTSVADEHIAINAFHKGLIDAYVRKSEISSVDQLNAHIYRLQKAYFASVFAPLMLTVQTYHQDIEKYPIFTKEYDDIKEELVQRHDIVEHYLCEGVGTSLLLDKKGQSYFLHCKYEQDYKSFDKKISSFQRKKLETRLFLLPSKTTGKAKKVLPAQFVQSSVPFSYAWSKGDAHRKTH